MTVASSRRSLLVAALLLSLMLSACQSLVRPEQQSDEQDEVALKVLIRDHEAVLESRDAFEVSGGLGIWTDEESLSARISWLQRPELLHLTLTGPLALGTMQLEDTAGVATLTRGGKTLARGGSADRVLQQGLGLAAPVPVQELAYWLRGLPGNANRMMRDAQGKLSSLRFTDELGTFWQVRFLRYTEWDGAALPALITASGGHFSVRLVLKNWQYAVKTVVLDTPKSNNRLPIPGR